MSRLITQIISPAAFEYIRDRIIEILLVEIDGQYILTYDPDIEPDVALNIFMERQTPVDKVEMSTIIVSLASGGFGNKSQASIDGDYVYQIDVFTNAKSTATTAGDTASSVKLQKIMRICRGILEDPVYKTLAFATPFIMKTYVSEFNIAAGNREDSLNSSMGRITFNVQANETSKLKVPSNIAGYKTSVRIDNTGKGYFYQGDL
jgi:hypothetical protein